MARKEYLSYDQRQRFDSPPILNNVQRAIFVQLPDWAEHYYKTLSTPTNQVGFLLQLGYFRIVCRFFESLKFREEDISFVQNSGKNIDPNEVDMILYKQSSSYYRHQREILSHLGFEPFNSQHQLILLKEAKRLAHLQVKPANILDSCIVYLRERRIEIPSYSSMRNIIHTALSEYESDLEQTLEKHLRQEDKVLLDELLSKPETFQRYELTFLKRIPQSMRPSVIKYRVSLFERFKAMILQLDPLIKKLNLSDATIRYYAEYVLGNRSANMARRGTDKYLLLIAFVIHQYMSLGDALILTLLNALSGCLNKCDNRIKEQLYRQRYQTAALVGQVTNRNKVHLDVLGMIEKIANDDTLDDSRKVLQIKNIINYKRINPVVLEEDHRQVLSLQATQQKVQQGQELYWQLEKESIYLQNRVSLLLQCLDFDKSSSQTDIWKAVNYYQDRQGEIAQNIKLPLDFLTIIDRGNIYTDGGKLRISLYKALLFKEIVLHLKAGSLNVLSSYEYRSYEQYLIDRQKWTRHKGSLLKQACLENCQSAGNFLLNLNQNLNQQFKYVNEGLKSNPSVYFDKDGRWHLHRYRAGEREAPYVLDALSHDEIISADAHSTDTHGYTEAIAAITGIWGIESRPRLATIHKLQLYSIDATSIFKEMEYRILPNQKVDYELIIQYWDDILRLVTTIKLGHEKASTLLRRLNSYSRQNPLYKALKELGRLYKTIYILRYISQQDLRRSVEAVLSKVENANHFAKAVMVGNPQEFNWSTHYDQLIAEGCKRLIINSINFYNLLLLSQQICNCKSAQQKEELIKLISQTSTHTWHHINLHGEFDFREQQVAPTFDMEAIMSLSVAENPGFTSHS